MPGVQFRAGRPQDRAAVDRLTDVAFSSDPGPRPQPAGAAGAAGPAEPEDPSVLVRVAERTADAELLAAASVRLGGQWWGGRRVPAAALSGVAVDLTARGGGVGTALLGDVFAAARGAGALLVALIPSTHRFYRLSGCGTAGRRPVFSIPAHHLRALPRGARDLTFRAARAQDAPAVAELVARRAARGNGSLEHHGPTGAAALEFVAERDGDLVGWCALGRRPARHGLYTVVVHDLVGADAAAELALWRDLVADTPSAREVVALLPGGSVLEHHLERQTEPVENATWMLGLLDVPGALAARGYPAGLTARVRFDVPDAGLSCVLEVADGTGRVLDGARSTTDVRVGVQRADLASLYAGSLDPVTARYAGLLDTDAAGAAVLRTLFAGPPAVLHRPF